MALSANERTRLTAAANAIDVGCSVLRGPAAQKVAAALADLRALADGQPAPAPLGAEAPPVEAPPEGEPSQPG